MPPLIFDGLLLPIIAGLCVVGLTYSAKKVYALIMKRRDAAKQVSIYETDERPNGLIILG